MLDLSSDPLNVLYNPTSDVNLLNLSTEKQRAASGKVSEREAIPKPSFNWRPNLGYSVDNKIGLPAPLNLKNMGEPLNSSGSITSLTKSVTGNSMSRSSGSTGSIISQTNGSTGSILSLSGSFNNGTVSPSSIAVSGLRSPTGSSINSSVISSSGCSVLSSSGCSVSVNSSVLSSSGSSVSVNSSVLSPSSASSVDSSVVSRHEKNSNGRHKCNTMETISANTPSIPKSADQKMHANPRTDELPSSDSGKLKSPLRKTNSPNPQSLAYSALLHEKRRPLSFTAGSKIIGKTGPVNNNYVQCRNEVLAPVYDYTCTQSFSSSSDWSAYSCPYIAQANKLLPWWMQRTRSPPWLMCRSTPVNHYCLNNNKVVLYKKVDLNSKPPNVNSIKSSLTRDKSGRWWLLKNPNQSNNYRPI